MIICCPLYVSVTRYTIIHENIHSKVFKSGYVLNCSSPTLLQKEFAKQQNQWMV
jgi:hypothetical protein